MSKNKEKNYYICGNLDMETNTSELQQANGGTAEFYTVLAFDEVAFVLVCLPRTGTLDRDRLETAA